MFGIHSVADMVTSSSHPCVTLFHLNTVPVKHKLK